MRINEIGQSQRQAWDRCPAYHYHAYMMGDRGWGITRPLEPLAQLFGRAGHLGLQTWYSMLRTGNDPIQSIEPSIAAMQGFIKETREKLSEGDWNALNDMEERGAVSLCMVESFMDGYASFYGEKDKALDIAALEWSFSLSPQQFYGEKVLDYVSKLGYRVDDLPFVRGTVDLAYRTKEGLIVMDHKFERFVGGDLTIGLPYWVQPITYCRAISQVMGEKVVGYQHNQIRKASGLKPRNTKDYTESYEEFLARIRAEYIEFPDYAAEYRSGGRAKKGYFIRSGILPIPDAPTRFLLEMAIEDARRVAIYRPLPDTVGWQEPPPTICRRHASCEMYGETCPYAMLCSYGYNPATFEGFVERSEPHK